MNAMSELHDLAGPYVIHALTDIERRAYENHLTRCATCRDEVAHLRITSELLAAATPHQPPADLRDLIMSKTLTMPQQRPKQTSRAPSANWLVAAAAALVLALVGGGFWATGLSRTNGHLAAQVSLISAVLAAPDVRATSSTLGNGGRATILSSYEKATVVFVGIGLTRPDTAHTYELWWMTAAGKALPAGTFSPSANGSAVASMPLQAGSGTVGLTIEPVGGSKQPTTKPIVLVPVNS